MGPFVWFLQISQLHPPEQRVQPSNVSEAFLKTYSICLFNFEQIHETDILPVIGPKFYTVDGYSARDQNAYLLLAG